MRKPSLSGIIREQVTLTGREVGMSETRKRFQMMMTEDMRADLRRVSHGQSMSMAEAVRDALIDLDCDLYDNNHPAPTGFSASRDRKVMANFHLSEEEREGLDKAASEMGVSAAAAARRALRDWLNYHGKVTLRE